MTDERMGKQQKAMSEFQTKTAAASIITRKIPIQPKNGSQPLRSTIFGEHTGAAKDMWAAAAS
jgi:hypothetical protein